MDRVSLIYKVLSQDATAEERVALEDWLKKSKENREEFENIRLLWEHTRAPEKSSLVDDTGFEQVKRRMMGRLQKKRQVRLLFSTLLLIVSVLILVTVFRTTWFAPVEHLRFAGVRMVEVIPVLEERYGIEIKVADPRILTCRYTATLSKVDDEHLVLKSIEHSLNVKFVAGEGRRYRLIGDGCSSTPGFPARQ